MSDDENAWCCALRLVQSFDPAGVAASSPTHALLIQLSRLNVPETIRSLACELLSHMPETLARRDHKAAAKALGVAVEDVEQAHDLILSLNPHPASAFADIHEAGCVIAEVLLVKADGRWKAILNPAVVSRLRFDDETYNLLTQAKLHGEDLAEWKARARDARGFVRALEMRYSTITAVAQTIADMQEAFFTEGPKALKPMGLKDIAARLGLSESTVSRAAAGKYLQSPSGSFELKYFFYECSAKRRRPDSQCRGRPTAHRGSRIQRKSCQAAVGRGHCRDSCVSRHPSGPPYGCQIQGNRANSSEKPA